MSERTTSQPEPCPFCGSAPRLAGHAPYFSDRIVCDHCLFWLPPEAWNRRAPKADTQPAAQPIDSLDLYKALCDAVAEATAVDTVIGRPEVLRAKLVALRDLVGGTTCANIAPAAQGAGLTDAEARHLGNLLTKLPSFDPAWPTDVRDGWMRCFATLRSIAAAHGELVPADFSLGACPSGTGLSAPAPDGASASIPGANSQHTEN